MFTQDNTEGFTDDQLSKMNELLNGMLMLEYGSLDVNKIDHSDRDSFEEDTKNWSNEIHDSITDEHDSPWDKLFRSSSTLYPTNRVLSGTNDHWATEEWCEDGEILGFKCLRYYLFSESETMDIPADQYPWDVWHVSRYELD